MTQESGIASEFPGDLPAIQRLRSEDPVFAEICDDLELLGRDLALFSEEERLRKQGAYLDIQESIQALRQELIEILRRRSNSAADGL
jgi:hypothetical protein